MMTIGAGTGYATDGQPVLLIASAAWAVEAERVVAQVGGRILQRIDWATLSDGLGEPVGRFTIVAEATGVAPDVLDRALPRLDGFAAALDLPIVISFAADQIDPVTAALGGPHVALLCDPTPVDRIVALVAAGRPRDPLRLNDSWRESESVRLQRLNDEVARIADMLARLARPEAARSSADVADRRNSYEPGPARPVDPVTPQEVRRRIQLRRLRGKFFDLFGEGLFEDPAWDMLLDLYAAELEGRQVSVSSLCIAAAVAPTTALRWIAKMTDSGLFVRHPDPVDRRRAFMGLSRPAAEAMRGYMVAARRAEG